MYEFSSLSPPWIEGDGTFRWGERVKRGREGGARLETTPRAEYRATGEKHWKFWSERVDFDWGTESDSPRGNLSGRQANAQMPEGGRHVNVQDNMSRHSRAGEDRPEFDLDQRSDHCQWSYLCSAKDQLKRQDLDQDQDLRSRSYHVHRHTLGLEIFGFCPLPWSHTLCTHTQETG